MRFMVMHKQMEEMPESYVSTPEFQKLFKEMGALIGEAMKNGTFKNGAGLKGSKYRTRLTFRGGECVEQQDGPYVGKHNEHIAGFALVKVKTKDEALNYAKQFGKFIRDGEMELGLVTEPWDLGVMPRPENPPLQFLMLNKATKKSESGALPSEADTAAMMKMMEEWTKAGVMQSAEGVMPSSNAVRLQFKGKKRTVIDGPFAESKELVGGFSILELPSREEAIAWTDRYAAILGDVEVDVLRLYEGP
jgi:hypothetical protein